MFFMKPELTSGSRPILQQDETILFVQNNVGLYEGKYKIAGCQNGHAYLTSHRICYVDDTNPRTNSLAVDLRDVERHEHQAGFLRSSAKITIHPKNQRRDLDPWKQQPSSPSAVQRLQSSSLPVSRTGSPFRTSSVPAAALPRHSGNWTCTICSFSNPIPSNFDPSNTSFPIPPCLTCGIKPEFSVVLRAAIAATSSRLPPTLDNLPTSLVTSIPNSPAQPFQPPPSDPSVCPRCTYQNHASLQYCELCETPLPRAASRIPEDPGLAGISRTESPGLEISNLNLDDQDDVTYFKLSFRAGGDKVFQDRLKNGLIQRKWLASSAPPAPRPLDSLRNQEANSSGSGSPERSNTPKPQGVGIAGLEQRGLQSRRNNEAVIGTAFADLEALMASAREIVALAEQFSSESGVGLGEATSLDPLLSQSAAAVGMIATKDMLGSDSTNNKLYISELSRILAEYIVDARRGILRGQGGVMSLLDLWAHFNRSRNGVELISPTDFHKAAQMWTPLNLPVRLRQFKSGLLVVQHHDRTDAKTLAQLTSWIKSIRPAAASSHPTDQETRTTNPAVPWDWVTFGHGVTAQDAAQKFGWSLGVATEELEMAEEKGALCREEDVQGLKFWVNYLVVDDE